MSVIWYERPVVVRSKTADKTTGSLLSASVKYAILCFYGLMDRAGKGIEREKRKGLSIAIKLYMLIFHCSTENAPEAINTLV